MGHVSHVDEEVSSTRVGDEGFNEDHYSTGAVVVGGKARRLSKASWSVSRH